mmetsp:Transcript_116309/g.290396  ORF Transcript_116309/g.290396 Transcript_116309/m.290396 type:complete len:268 (-) Transcript_116309:417-1220(-)
MCWKAFSTPTATLDCRVRIHNCAHASGTTHALCDGHHWCGEVAQRDHAKNHREENHDNVRTLIRLACGRVDARSRNHMMGPKPEGESIQEPKRTQNHAESESHVASGNDATPPRLLQVHLKVIGGPMLPTEGGDDADGHEGLLGDSPSLAEPTLLLALRCSHLLSRVQAESADERDRKAEKERQFPSLDEGDRDASNELRAADNALTHLCTDRILDSLRLDGHMRGQGCRLIGVKPTDIPREDLVEVVRSHARGLPLSRQHEASLPN